MKKGHKYTHTFEVNNKIHTGFIDLFSDRNVLHVDDSYAVSKGFVSKVMHGNILNGFVSYFIGELLEVDNVIIHSQEIKYKNPVYLDDILTFEAEITDVIDSVNVLIMTFKFVTIRNVAATGKIQIGLI